MTALDDITLNIAQGELVAIVGTSGSGKTTLLHILGSLDVPTAGEYTLDGEHMNDVDDITLSHRRNKLIGFVFQNFNLLPRATALENVLTPGLYSATPPTEADALQVMEKVNIAHRKSHYPSEMSGGEQQRVAIARALIMRPSLLLADEPTGNLDSATSDQIMQVFHDLNSEGLTIVMVTHGPGVAAQAGRVITIKDGRILSDITNETKPLSNPQLISV